MIYMKENGKERELKVEDFDFADAAKILLFAF